MTYLENIRVYAVAPHVYATDMATRVGDSSHHTLQEFARFANPVYPGKPGTLFSFLFF